MNKIKTFLMAAVLPLLANSAVYAVDVDDITDALYNNYNDVNDFTVDMVCDSTNNVHDVSASDFYYKKAASSKFRVDISQPDNELIRCDGTNVKIDFEDTWTKTYFVTNDNSNIGWISRMFRETDVLWILANNTFTLAGSNFTVNGVTCRKIYCSDYDIFVDESQYAKIIRIDRKVNGNMARRYNLGEYTFSESTAWMWTSIVASDAGGTETYDIDYSNLTINDSLNDSLFQ